MRAEHIGIKRQEIPDLVLLIGREILPGRGLLHHELAVRWRKRSNEALSGFDGIDEPDWGARTVAQLERDVDNGAVGLKIFKSLGLSVVDSNGERVAVDDLRLDPVWKKCGDLGIPVLIHTAEPAPTSMMVPTSSSCFARSRASEAKRLPKAATAWP